jgi:4-hydroxybenzoate polyprenyltransferase
MMGMLQRDASAASSFSVLLHNLSSVHLTQESIMKNLIQYANLYPERIVLWLTAFITLLLTTYMAVSLTKQIEPLIIIICYIVSVASLYYYSYQYKQHRNKTGQTA